MTEIMRLQIATILLVTQIAGLWVPRPYIVHIAAEVPMIRNVESDKSLVCLVRIVLIVCGR